MFEHVEPFAGDPILALVERFSQDPRAHKVNLSIGIYFDEEGRIPVLPSVREAEARVVAAAAPKPYLPIEGAANFRAAVQTLIFGPDHAVVSEQRVATIQSVGSSGGLKVGADFIQRWLPGSAIWVSDPSWDNHRSMFEGAGLTVHTYPYHDAASGGLRFDAMCETLSALPKRSVVLLHACCHNPTGVDLSDDQWQALLPILAERELLPFVDLAYQGFGIDMDTDAGPVRLLADAGLSFIVANSFSKTMSLYGERAGGLSVVCRDRDEAERVLGQLKFAVRRNYSSPPIHGGQIAATILTDNDLRSQWQGEVAAMRTRIKAMRVDLHRVLSAKLPGAELDYFLTQQGMFSYTGLSAAQVDRLRDEFAVYLVRSGRVCIAGLNTGNVERTAQAMAAVMR